MRGVCCRFHHLDTVCCGNGLWSKAEHLTRASCGATFLLCMDSIQSKYTGRNELLVYDGKGLDDLDFIARSASVDASA